MATSIPMKKVETTPGKPVTAWENSFGFPLFHRLSRELDTMFDRFGIERPLFDDMPAAWTPEVEMFTKDNELHVKVDVPGMKKEEVTVEVTDAGLVVRGERKQEKEEKTDGFYKTERTYGSFCRTMTLPDGVNPDLAKASMHDGVLEVVMPTAKVEEKSRKLEIGEPAPAAPSKAA